MVSRAKAPKRWVGLDVGSRSMKVVELEPSAAGVRLVKCLIQELPIARDGHAPDRAGWLQSALKEFDAADVHVSLSDPTVTIRRMPLPLMPQRELAGAVQWEVKDHLPFPVQEAVLDFCVIGEVWDKDIKKHDVLVAAAPRALVQELVQTVERSGGRVASVMPTECATWRCVSTLLPDASTQAVAVVEIGASHTEVTIAKDGAIRLVRKLPVGSATLTEALVGAVASERGEVAIDVPKAEALKRRYGVVGEAAEGMTDEGVPLFHLASLMRPVLERLLTELSRVVEFYKTQLDEGGVSRILLCGAGANVKHLHEFLADGLGMTVQVFNPLIRMPGRLQPLDPEQITEDGPRLAAAIGLAMEHGEGLNLLPEDVRRRRRSAASQHLWRGLARGAAICAAAVYLGLAAWGGALSWQIHRQREVWKELEPAYQQAMGLASSRRVFEGAAVTFERFVDRQPIWDGLLKELAQLLPATVVLDELTLTADAEGQAAPMRFHANGKVMTGAGSGEGSLAQLVEAMERSIFFKDVELVSSELHAGETGTSHFELEAALE